MLPRAIVARRVPLRINVDGLSAARYEAFQRRHASWSLRRSSIGSSLLRWLLLIREVHEGVVILRSLGRCSTGSRLACRLGCGRGRRHIHRARQLRYVLRNEFYIRVKHEARFSMIETGVLTGHLDRVKAL